MKRFYIPSLLEEGIVILLSEAQTHYLSNVLRQRIDRPLLLFNEKDGEWEARLEKSSVKKKY